ESDRAWRTLRAMLAGPDADDCIRRGQLPVFVPNYYRGAWRLHPRTAGRSSQLFNTGTAAWMYRCTVESLCGLRGDGDGLRIAPRLAAPGPRARALRRVRGAEFDVQRTRGPGSGATRVEVDGRPWPGGRLADVEAGRRYRVAAWLPEAGGAG